MGNDGNGTRFVTHEKCANKRDEYLDRAKATWRDDMEGLKKEMLARETALKQTIFFALVMIA